MRRMRGGLVLQIGVAGLLAAGVLTNGGCARASAPAPVVLIGVDAFRWDFMEKAPTPNLDRLAAHGVRAEWMVPVFPSKTFPNHYSVVTGLYPEHHGIVANTMYDEETDARFSLGNRDAVSDGHWWGGEPIWVTVEKAGRTAAAFFWPGTEAAIQGIRPTHWRPYVHDTPNDDRVDQVLAWLDLPEAERPAFVTLYFADVDDATHRYGIDAPETAAAIGEVDRAIGRLLDGLDTRGRLAPTNVIVVSDHGMAPTSRDRVIFLDELVDADLIEEVVDWSPVAAIRPKAGMQDTVLRQLAGAHPRLQVFRKSEIPERWHYRAHRRIQPILAVADEGWEISSRAYFTDHPDAYTGAQHGYDNAVTSMQAFFLAAGPSFREGTTVPPFQNIHVYELLCRILGVPPAPNDGSVDSVRLMLR